jgi:enoyl-CoA hydratase/carnithine racemase
MPEVRDGIPAVFGLELLWDAVGMSRALYLVLSGEALDAQAALAAGLTVKVVPRERLRPEAEALARALAGYAPLAIRQNKAYARWRTEGDFRACARFAEGAHHASFAVGDARRGMEAFLARKR